MNYGPRGGYRKEPNKEFQRSGLPAPRQPLLIGRVLAWAFWGCPLLAHASVLHVSVLWLAAAHL